jgi:hypothetical protein
MQTACKCVRTTSIVTMLTTFFFVHSIRILIDDADIIFDDDAGFWTALNQLIETSRKPVILTATNNIESLQMLVKHMNTIRIDAPSSSAIQKQLVRFVYRELDDACYKLQEQTRANWFADDQLKPSLISIVKHCSESNGDIRKSINRLQFEMTPLLFGKLSVESESNGNVEPVLISADSTDRPLTKEDLQRFGRLSVKDILAEQSMITKTDDYGFAIRKEIDFSWKRLSHDIDKELQKESGSKRTVEQRFMTKQIEQNHLDSSQNVCDVLNLIPCQTNTLNLDYIPYLSSICLFERDRFDFYSSNTRKSRRFMHYLDNIQLILTDECRAFLLHYFD